MAISSNTLFHFTSKLSTVEAILLSGGFWPKYCIEYGWKKKFAVSQCCFCDIPLANIKPHMETYGNYGIGMTKEWGIRKGISPVFYVLKNAQITRTLRNILSNAKQAGANIKDNEARLISMMKIYEGVNYRFEEGLEQRKQIKDYKYYNEREWRFVPELKGRTQIKLIDSEAVFYETKNELDNTAKGELCTFTPSDVKYILVNDMDDRKGVISSIDKMQYSQEEKDLLKSKIIQSELIKEDI